MMEKVGNAKANEYWEKNLPPDYHRPDPNKDGMAAMEKFIRFKYEYRKWADPTVAAPNELVLDPNAKPPPPRPSRPTYQEPPPPPPPEQQQQFFQNQDQFNQRPNIPPNQDASQQFVFQEMHRNNGQQMPPNQMPPHRQDEGPSIFTDVKKTVFGFVDKLKEKIQQPTQEQAPTKPKFGIAKIFNKNKNRENHPPPQHPQEPHANNQNPNKQQQQQPQQKPMKKVTNIFDVDGIEFIDDGPNSQEEPSVPLPGTIQQPNHEQPAPQQPQQTPKPQQQQQGGGLFDRNDIDFQDNDDQDLFDGIVAKPNQNEDEMLFSGSQKDDDSEELFKQEETVSAITPIALHTDDGKQKEGEEELFSLFGESNNEETPDLFDNMTNENAQQQQQKPQDVFAALDSPQEPKKQPNIAEDLFGFAQPTKPAQPKTSQDIFAALDAPNQAPAQQPSQDIFGSPSPKPAQQKSSQDIFAALDAPNPKPVQQVSQDIFGAPSPKPAQQKTSQDIFAALDAPAQNSPQNNAQNLFGDFTTPAQQPTQKPKGSQDLFDLLSTPAAPPKASNDPFASPQPAPQKSTDPFEIAVSQSQKQHQAAPSFGNDPFAAAASPQKQTSSSGFPSDPFGAAPSKPQQQTATPFGGSDPFAAAPAKAPASAVNDPFGMAAPHAQPKPQTNAFGFGQPQQGAPKSAHDLFGFSQAPQQRQGFGSVDPFAAQPANHSPQRPLQQQQHHQQFAGRNPFDAMNNKQPQPQPQQPAKPAEGYEAPKSRDPCAGLDGF